MHPSDQRELRLALADAQDVTLADPGCGEGDLRRVQQTWGELQQSLVSRGFQLVSADAAHLFVHHLNFISSCGYDGSVDGQSSLVLATRDGRVIERVSLFPLWPDGLVEQLLYSTRLKDFVDQNLIVASSSVAVSNPAPNENIKWPDTELVVVPFADAAGISADLRSQLSSYVRLRLTELRPRVDAAAPTATVVTGELLKVGDLCAVAIRIAEPNEKSANTATERGPCTPDGLMSSIDRGLGRIFGDANAGNAASSGTN